MSAENINKMRAGAEIRKHATSLNCRMMVLLLVFSFIACCIAQVRMEYSGSTEIPSLKCVLNPQQIDLDINAKTLCYCVWINVPAGQIPILIPMWNCMKADVKATYSDLIMVKESIENLTSSFSLAAETQKSDTRHTKLSIPPVDGSKP